MLAAIRNGMVRILGRLPRLRLKQSGLSGTANTRGGWLPVIRESFAGAFQQNVEIKRDVVLTHFAVFSCMTLIANDIAKLRLKLVRKSSDGIWEEFENSAHSPVLRKPNAIQTRIQFWECWMLSKLSNGNVYVLKERDERNVVTALHVLDPQRVQVLVTDDGGVFYRLSSDNIAGIENDVIVPAREIIHDRMNCLFHPLIGLSPIVAAALAAMQGINIQRDAATFFGNASMPSGILVAPGAITDTTAKRLKEHWQENYGGKNAGKIAVLGDGLKFEQMRAAARDSQLIEQLRWTAEVVCSVFHVPPYKIGVGTLPSYNNVQALNVEYYSQALQILIESAEVVLDDGLAMSSDTGTEFDLDGLLRMDSVTQLDVIEKAKSVLTLDERRRRLEMGAITGGDTVYLQQQDHSIEAIAARDKMLIDQANNPPVTPTELAERAREMLASALSKLQRASRLASCRLAINIQVAVA